MRGWGHRVREDAPVDQNMNKHNGTIPNDHDVRTVQFNQIPILTVAWRRGDREAGTDVGNGNADHSPRNHAALT